jgi:uncharacterized C2H2 Zn-finger protein
MVKNNTKKVIRFTYITEYKTLEKYFEEMAAKGLMIYEIIRNTLVFKGTTPRELTFNVSLFYHRTPFTYPDEEKDRDYRELCEESGWKFCTSNDIYQIFYKEKDAEAIPIHTDPYEEYKIIKSIFMKTDFVSIILLLLIVGMGLINTFNFNYESLFSNSTLFAVISPIFLMIIVISIYVFPIIWFIKNKINLLNGKELTFFTNKVRLIRNIITWSLISVYFILTISAVSNGFTNPFMVMFVFIPVFIPALIAIYCFKKFKTKKRTQKQNIIFFLIIIIFTTCITLGIVMSIAFSRIRIGENDDIPKEIAVLELSDFGTNDIPERTKVYKQSSIFIPVNIEYYESLGRKPKYNEIMTVRTSYIQCINKKIADYVFEGFMKKEQKRLKKRVAEYQEFDSEEKAKEEKNKIREVSKSLWNIGRGYYISGNKSEIIIQKDNVIYILDSDVDFSEKEIVNICEEKFGL